MHLSTHWLGRGARRTLLALAAALGLGTTAARAQAPANDDPCGATVLTPQGNLCLSPTVSTNAGATTTPPNGYNNPGTNNQVNGCGIAANPKDVWFKFTTAATGLASFGATITVSGNAAGLLRLFAAPSCAGPFTSIQCSGGTGSNTVAGRLTTAALSPNTTYYVQVAGYASTDVQGPFTICLTDGPGVPECLPVSNIRLTFPPGLQPDQGVLTFTPGANNVPPYTITLGGNGSVTRSFNTMASPVTLSGLMPGSFQVATISSACAFGGTASTQYPLNLPALNRTACDALPLSVNPTCVPTGGDLYFGGSGSPGCSNSSGVGYKTLWYKFATATSGPASTQATVNLSSSSGANELRVWSGNPCASGGTSNLTLLGCSSPNSSGTPTTPLTFTTLAPGTTYYVQVGLARFASSQGTFTVCVTAPGGCSAPRFNVSNITGTSAVVNFSSLVTAAAPTGYTLTYQAAGGGPVQTLSPPPTAPTAVLTGLLPGTTYTVTLTAACAGGGVSVPATGTFATTATAPACAEATGLSITNITGNSATLSFTPAAGASSYVVSYQAAGSSPQVVAPAPTTSPVQLTGLLPGTTYAVLVQATCASGSSVTQTVNFVTPALTASNDNCATAVVLPVGTVCQFTRVTTAGATASSGVPAPGCATVSTIYDVWGSLTVPANGIVQVTTGSAGSNVNDTGLALYGGSCGSLTLLGCNDDYSGGGDFSQVRLINQTPGATLYVRMWALGVGSTGGIFQVCAQTDASPPAPTCAAPTAVAATAPTPYTATVSFVPGAGSTATGYTVTATPGGGGAVVTASGAGSPVALAGLAAGTTYTLAVVANCPNSQSSTAAPGTLTTPLATAQSALAAQVSLYPNPAHRACVVQVPAALAQPGAPARLCNSLGQVLRQQPLQARSGAGTEATFDLAGLAPGVYVLQVPTPAGLLARRLVVE